MLYNLTIMEFPHLFFTYMHVSAFSLYSLHSSFPPFFLQNPPSSSFISSTSYILLSLTEPLYIFLFLGSVFFLSENLAIPIFHSTFRL